MAKIIGYKNLKKYKAICVNCGAIVVFDEDEVKDDYQYNEYCFSVGVCPACNEGITFNKNTAQITGTETENY